MEMRQVGDSDWMVIVHQAGYLTISYTKKKGGGDQINTGTTSASIANVKHSLHHLSFLQTGYKSQKWTIDA